MRKLAIIIAACAVFWAGHVLGASKRERSAAATPAWLAPAGTAAASANAGRDLAALGSALGAAVEEVRRNAGSPGGAEVRETIQEQAAQREARHRYLIHEAMRLYPTLAPGKCDQLVELADRNEDQFRAERAAFMLGDVTEDDYVAALKQMIRGGVEETKQFLTRDEFIALEGNPDYDPFDPRAHEVSGQAPYVSPEEAAAMFVDPGSGPTRAASSSSSQRF